MTIFINLSAEKLKQAKAHATVQSGTNHTSLEADGLAKPLLLNEEHTFTISVNTTNPSFDYPPILMRWDNGFHVLSSNGWNGSDENEFSLSPPVSAVIQPVRSIDLTPGEMGIGILIVGTGELGGG